MTFTVDTLEQTRDKVCSDFEVRMPGTSPRARRSVIGAVAIGQAGAVQGLNAHIEYRWRNMLPDELADAEGVERWARRYKLWYREATLAAGTVQLTGSSGATLLAGTALQYTQDQLYTTSADATLVAGTATVPVVAQTAGAAGNLAAGARLSLVSPAVGIASAVLVDADGLTGGTDAEDLAGLRTRVNNRMANPPQGGSLTDYETWALESHPSITRAWATEHEQGSGSVVVRIVCDNEADPIPTQAVLDACAAYIAKMRPAGRRSVYVLPPVAAPVVFQIHAVPNTAQVRAAIEAELRDLIRRDAMPSGSLLLSRIRAAVSNAAGETDNSVVQPAADVVTATGQMVTFGGIEWV